MTGYGNILETIKKKIFIPDTNYLEIKSLNIDSSIHIIKKA
jgi:hypothetical protein